MKEKNNYKPKEREYRSFNNITFREENDELIVEGYAVVFDTPTVLFDYDGIEYKEQIATTAFDEADMKDVIMNYNHDGKVVARLKNSTLKLEVDDFGLKITAFLGGTQEGRNLYEEIKGGYISDMSFAFTVAKDSYDRDTRTTTIEKIKKLYDVSAVSIPAYPTTSLSARSKEFYDVEHSKFKVLEREQLELAKIKAKYKGGKA